MIIGISGPITIAPLIQHLDFSPQTVAPEGLGGSPVVALIDELLKRGRRIVVFTLDRRVTSEVILEGPRLKICIGPYRPTKRARDFFRVERDYLLSAMRRERPDMIHAHWPYEFAMAALDSGRPTLVTAHDAPLRILRYFPDAYRFIRLLMACSVIRRTQHLTTVSDYLAGSYRRNLFYRSPISIIPNAVPQEAFELGRWRLQQRRTGAFTVATVLNGWKGLKNGPAALQAFSKLRRGIPNARLLMFGGDYESGGEAELWARSRNLHQGVDFRGSTPYRDLLFRLSREADVLLHPSKEESFGMAVAEAMALGLPVVGGSNSGAIPSLLEDGNAGSLVNVSSPACMSSALSLLASNPSARQQLGEAAFESAYKRFRSEIVVDRYEALYGQIC